MSAPATDPTTGLGERYLRLALHLGRLDDGVIDAYFGPVALAGSVGAEDPPAAADLVADAEALLADLDDSWLRDQVVGLRTVAGRLAGEQIAYPDEVEACYGVRPVHTDAAALAAAYDGLEALLPGPGSLWERYRAFEDSATVPASTIEALMADVVEEARARTRDMFGLPNGESIQLEYVRDTPWLGFHEYLGDLRGRIGINVDRPRSAISLLHLAVHETYAGHQPERCHKEVALVREQGLLEETIALVHGSPVSGQRGTGGARRRAAARRPQRNGVRVLGARPRRRARPGARPGRGARDRAAGLARRRRRPDAARRAAVRS